MVLFRDLFDYWKLILFEILKTKKFKLISGLFYGNFTVAFVSDEFIEKAATYVGPIEAINYFCEVKFEEELQLLQEEAVKKQAHSAKKRDKNRNTVLMVPKMEGLVRNYRGSNKMHQGGYQGFLKWGGVILL